VTPEGVGRFFVGTETKLENAELAKYRIEAAERGITLGEIQAIGGRGARSNGE
jgi:hypothetical protein